MAGEEIDSITYTVKLTVKVTVTDEPVPDRETKDDGSKESVEKKDEETTIRDDAASSVQVASCGTNRNKTSRKRKVLCDYEESEASQEENDEGSVESDAVAESDESMHVGAETVSLTGNEGSVHGYDMAAGDSYSVEITGRTTKVCRREKRGIINNAEIDNEEEADKSDDVADGGTSSVQLERETEKEALRNTGTFIQHVVPRKSKKKNIQEQDDHILPDQEEGEEEEDIEDMDVTAMEVQHQKFEGRWVIRPVGNSFLPGRPAAVSIKEVIQELYKHSWKTFGQLMKKDYELYKTWFDKFREKCVWDTLDDEMVERNFKKRATARLSDMLRRARLGWEEREIRPPWMGENVFKELLAYWKTDEFKKKSEKAKQRRASERGAANHRAGSISIADHAERMTNAKGRTPLMQELHERIYRGRDGEYSDERARNTQAEYQRLKEEFLSQHPELGGPWRQHSLDPAVDQYLWMKASKGKNKNGKIYATGPLAGNYKKGDRFSLFRRIADGEGSSRPPTLTPQMAETIRKLAQSKAAREAATHEAVKNAELEEMRKKQIELEEALRISQEKIMLTQQQMQQQMQQMQQMFQQQFGGGGVGAVGNPGTISENAEESENDEDYLD